MDSEPVDTADAAQQQFSTASLEGFTVTPGPGAEIQSYTNTIFQQSSQDNLERVGGTDSGSGGGGGGGERQRNSSVQSSSSKAAMAINVESLMPSEDDPDLYDPNCNPDSPQLIRFHDVRTAALKIRSGIVRTPCDKSHMSKLTNMEIYFKKEFLQYTGSFKERGARYVLLSLSKEQKERGVVAASAGNHALALAYHGQELGIPIVVVMPTIAPLMKINSCVQYGARVIVKGNHIGESRNLALKIAKSEGLLYVNGYDHPHILAGQGTVGLEILEQLDKQVDAIIVPVGGGGLIAGVSVAVKTMSPNTLIIGAEPERSASFTAAIKAGHPVKTALKSSLADGLAVPLAGANAFYSCKDMVDKTVTVSEEFIALAILRLIELEKTVVEGAGATALAAVLEGRLPELEGKTIAVILGGGNIDTTVLGRVLERGLAVDGRLIHFVVTVSDRPGGIAELSAMLASFGVSIKDIFHERAWLKSDIFQVNVRCVCEVRDREQGEELVAKLRDHYGAVKLIGERNI